MRNARHTMTAICLAAIGIAMLDNSFVGSLGPNSIAAAAEGFARLSPFTDLRYETDDRVWVEYNSQWYELVSIDDRRTVLLLQTARESFGELWQKRFAEDLVEVMEAAGKRPNNAVKLVLRRAGKLSTIEQAPMTADNRQQIYRNYRRWLTGAREPRPAMSPIEDAKSQPADASAPSGSFDGLFQVTWSVRQAGSKSTQHSAGDIKSIRIRKRVIVLLKRDGGGYLIPTDSMIDFAWVPVDSNSFTEKGAAGSGDQARIQGTWEIVAAEFSGSTDASAIGGHHAILDNRIIRPNRRTRDYQFELDPRKSLKTIDLSADRLGDATLKGIYALTEDTLKVCYAYDPKLPRPKQFATKSGDRVYRYIYRRVVAHSARRQPSRVPFSNPFLSSVPGYPLWSAFTGVKWEGNQPIVRVEGKWYELVSFHGIPVEQILQHCRANGWPVKMRFTEDLVQIVRLMGHEIDKTTDLELRDENGNHLTMKNVEMTEANLRQIMSTGGLSDSLSADDVRNDLAVFRRALESQFSYLKSNGADYQTAIQAIGERADGMDAIHLANELQKVIALFIDGHAGVSSSTASFASGYLPFLIEPSDNRFVAVLSDRSDLLHADYPYTVAMDGVEIEICQ